MKIFLNFVYIDLFYIALFFAHPSLTIVFYFLLFNGSRFTDPLASLEQWSIIRIYLEYIMWFTKNPLAVIFLSIVLHYFGVWFMEWIDTLYCVRESYRPNANLSLKLFGLYFRCFWVVAIFMTFVEIHIVLDSRK